MQDRRRPTAADRADINLADFGDFTLRAAMIEDEIEHFALGWRQVGGFFVQLRPTLQVGGGVVAASQTLDVSRAFMSSRQAI